MALIDTESVSIATPLIKQCVIYRFTLMIFSIIWRINYNGSIIISNIQCDVIKYTGETVSAGQHYCFISKDVVGKVAMFITKGCVICRLMSNISV